MRLRPIEVFHAIMRVGTISGAAARVLHISQPAVTKVAGCIGAAARPRIDRGST